MVKSKDFKQHCHSVIIVVLVAIGQNVIKVQHYLKFLLRPSVLYQEMMASQNSKMINGLHGIS